MAWGKKNKNSRSFPKGEKVGPNEQDGNFSYVLFGGKYLCVLLATRTSMA